MPDHPSPKSDRPSPKSDHPSPKSDHPSPKRIVWLGPGGINKAIKGLDESSAHEDGLSGEFPDYSSGLLPNISDPIAVSQYLSMSNFLIPTSNKEARARWDDTWFFAEGRTMLNQVGIYDTVRTLAGLFRPETEWESLSAKSQAYISSWAHNPEKYFTMDYSLHIMAAWVWHVLWDNLFSPECSDKWNGPHWAAYGLIRKQLEDHLEADDNCFARCFHSWRYASVHMLHMIHGQHSDPARLEAILRRELHELIEDSPARPALFDEWLPVLVDQAIYMDMMAESLKFKTVFHMDHPYTHERAGFLVGPEAKETMDIVGHCWDEDPDPSDLRVDFVLAMGVRIFGEKVEEGIPSEYHQISVNEYHVHNYTKLDSSMLMKVAVSANDDSPELPVLCEHFIEVDNEGDEKSEGTHLLKVVGKQKLKVDRDMALSL